MVCMAHASLRQSDVSFTEAEISGRTLEIIDREVLRDIGIKSVGRQLEILQSLKQLSDSYDFEVQCTFNNILSKSCCYLKC